MNIYILQYLYFSGSLNSEGETQYMKQQRTLSHLKEQLAELDNKCSQLNVEIKNNHEALFKGREERDKLRYEELYFLSYKYAVKEKVS